MITNDIQEILFERFEKSLDKTFGLKLKSREKYKSEFEFSLQDFDDKFILDVMQEQQFERWHELRDYLLEKVDDYEIQSHLLGFENSEERKQLLTRIKKLANDNYAE